MPRTLTPADLRALVEWAELLLSPLLGDFQEKHDLTPCETNSLFKAALAIIHCQVHGQELSGDPSHN